MTFDAYSQLLSELVSHYSSKAPTGTRLFDSCTNMKYAILCKSSNHARHVRSGQGAGPLGVSHAKTMFNRCYNTTLRWVSVLMGCTGVSHTNWLDIEWNTLES